MRALLALALICISSSALAETIFVAGATGRTGIEVVRVLHDSGYDVVASTRNATRAASTYPKVKTWVEVNAQDPARLRDAVAGSEIVVSALGHGDFVGAGAPQFVGYLSVRNLIDAAVAADAKQFILISSSTAGHARGVDHREEPRFGYVLFWKTKAEDYLRQSGLPYTIVGPGGLADDVLIQLRGIDPPPLEGWGARILARPDYERDFVSRRGVADVVKQSIANPAAQGKAVAVVWDKSVPAGEVTGAFADIATEPQDRTYLSK